MKRYFKEVKSLFPTFGKHEKKYLSELKAEAEDYAESVSDFDYMKLVSCFSEPSAIISEYFAKVDFPHLSKRIRILKYIKICTAVVVILAVTAGGYSAFHAKATTTKYLYDKAYKLRRKSRVNKW